SARLAGEELGDHVYGVDDVLALLEDANDAAAQRRPSLDQRLPIHGHVEVVGGQEAARGPTWQHGLDRLAAHEPTAVLFDQLSQWRTDRQLDDARSANVVRQSEEHRSRVVLAPLAAEPIRALA